MQFVLMNLLSDVSTTENPIHQSLDKPLRVPIHQSLDKPLRVEILDRRFIKTNCVLDAQRVKRFIILKTCIQSSMEIFQYKK